MWSEYDCSSFYLSVNDFELPSTVVPNLKTGEGHGHYRPLFRNKVKCDYHKHIHNKRKIVKRSRRRNRK